MIGINTKRLQSLNEIAQTPSQILGSTEPGFFSGAAKSISRGAIQGITQAQGTLASGPAAALQPVYDLLEDATGIKPWNPFASVRDISDSIATQYSPDPLTTGMAGQVMFELSRTLTQVGVGAAAVGLTGGALGSPMLGGAITAGASTGRATFQDFKAKGVDDTTALAAGAVDAAAVGGGVLIPAAIGYKALATPFNLTGAGASRATYYGANVAYGAAANVAMGAAQRGATHELLQAGGYTTMAQQYAPLDTASVAAEAILGAAFGAVGARAGLPSAGEQAAIDAALTARDAKHAAIDTAPGVPSDPASAAAHSRSMGAATQQLLSGQRVDVAPTGIEDGSFVTRPRSPEISDAARSEYLMDLPPAARYSPSDRLTAMPVVSRTRLRFDAPELNEYAAQVEQQYNLPPGLINALKNVGERSNSNQVSPRGARGVMQFMPENLRKYGVTDAADPVQMIDAAGRYLRDTMRQYGGHVDAVIADYNGGPRQAKEVLAGRQPKAKETQDYLRRVRQWLGREGSGRGQDPVALRQVVEPGAIVERMPVIQPEQARAARAIDVELAALDTERAQVLATAGNEAELGQIVQIRSELLDLQAQRSTLDETDVRPLAKEIQTNIPRTSYKEALSMARRQRASEAMELESRINRLEGVLRENALANQAAQQLSRIDEQATILRENRAMIETPPLVEQPLPGAVRSALSEMAAAESGVAPPPAGKAPGAPQPPTAGQPGAGQAQLGQPRTPILPQEPTQAIDATGPTDGTPPARQQTQSDSRIINAADDAETQAGLALLDEQGDIVVPMELENGEVVNVSLRQALAEADAELKYSTPEAFNAAVVCAMTKGE